MEQMMRQTTAAPAPRKRFGWTVRSAVLAAVVTTVAAVALTVQAQEHGAGWDGHGPGAMFGGGPEHHLAHRLDRMLDGLGATDAQRTQIRQIALAAARDIKTQRDAERDLHQRELALLAAPSVDAAAAESLRQQTEALHDQSSKRMLQSVLDISKVLTPEQRAKIGARLQEREAVWQERRAREEREHPEHPHE
jgi:Spy/CpxP family protein refolding chaperone